MSLCSGGGDGGGGGGGGCDSIVKNRMYKAIHLNMHSEHACFYATLALF